MTISLQPQLMSVQGFFGGSLFRIPDYQRAYAWEEKQWDDLWDDVREGMRTGTTHFLGTVVLMSEDTGKRDSEGRALQIFQVVDGQQRITTLSLLLITLDGYLRADHPAVADGLWRDFVQHEDDLEKLLLGGLNRDYWRALMTAMRNGSSPPPPSRSTNIRLHDAIRRFRDLIDSWSDGADETNRFLDLASYVREKLQILRFVTNSRQLAIKTFQVVNDRGKDLSLLDKSKSFLMFYATRYLEDDSQLFDTIEDAFGRVFDNYDRVRDLATAHDVGYLIRRFGEDEFLRYAYHYGMRDLRAGHSLQAEYEYGITPERVFDYFIKNACRALRNDAASMRSFIRGWCQDLIAVSDALVSLLQRIEDDQSYQQLFSFQGPNVSVYPLLIGAEAVGHMNWEMLRAIAILDLRVYKVRGTDPKADLYKHAVSKMKGHDRDEIYDHVVRFCTSFGSDRQLDSILRGHVYGHPFTKYVLWLYGTQGDRDVEDTDYEIYNRCQVDHLLPVDASTFDCSTFGFSGDEEYEATKHAFGNLSVLEEQLNKRARNSPPAVKGKIYEESALGANRVLGRQMREMGFRRREQTHRTDRIVEFFKRAWEIPRVAQASEAGDLPG